MTYLTKDVSNLIQLWNNKPELINGCWQAWNNRENCDNEIGIDVTNNDYFRNLFTRYEEPICLDIMLQYKPIFEHDIPTNDTNIQTNEELHWQDVRERAAIAALQGVMGFFGSIDYNRETIAKLAVEQADTFVEQLKKG